MPGDRRTQAAADLAEAQLRLKAGDADAAMRDVTDVLSLDGLTGTEAKRAGELRERVRTMNGFDRIGDHAGASYLQLSGDEAAGAAALARSGMEFGVLTDTDGHPRLLLTPDGRKASAVILDADDPMERVLAPDIIAILNAGVPGLVATRDAQVTGVLSAAAVSDYLVEYSPVRSADLGDEGLHGDAPVKLMTLTCTTCGTVNSVMVFAEGETQCSQGHPLTLWG